MQRYGDAVTPMQTNFKDVNFLNLRGDWPVEAFQALPPMVPFSGEVMAYLNALSKEIYKQPKTKYFADVATFAFYCRKSNLAQLQKKLVLGNIIKLGRGIVFHIAPSNVPVNFAYSLLVGLLSGNINIVRVPSQKFEQVEILVNAINSLAQNNLHDLVSKRIILIRYERGNNATAFLSSICDVRVIWGGDDTIKQIRKNPLPARSFDITFADRYSLCAINADQFVDADDQKTIASGFYNDTYLSDQNACTSPHLIIWTGKKENVVTAQSSFWHHLHTLAQENYQIEPALAVDKITDFFNQACQMDGVKRVKVKDNLLWRVSLSHLTDDIDLFHSKAGYFAEYHADSLEEVAIIVNRKYQTLAYFGFSKDELTNFIIHSKPSGIDRMVPIGRTMDFSIIWDGYNLIDSLSRKIEII
jgi:hypothetical protein